MHLLAVKSRALRNAELLKVSPQSVREVIRSKSDAIERPRPSAAGYKRDRASIRTRMGPLRAGTRQMPELRCHV